MNKKTATLTTLFVGVGLACAVPGTAHSLTNREIKGILTNQVDKIVGGTESDISKHPYVVSLESGTSHFCGGSLIAKNFVLTAGHCTDFIASSRIRIVIGSATHNPAQGEVFKVKKVTTDPLFKNADFPTHDFSVIELDGNSKFAPIDLIAQGEDAYATSQNHDSLVLGWGTTTESGSLSTKLLEVTVPITTDTDCSNSYPGDIDATMLCAGFVEGGKDSCQGDSGGPLVISDTQGKEHLAGIVSWGEGCARPNKYGVYARVAFASDWIKSVVAAPTQNVLAAE